MAVDTDEATNERRSARKRRRIVDAATAAFLRTGYHGTSMDDIAARAGVSKQTVYKQFGDKRRLFIDVVAATVNEASDPVHQEVQRLADSGDLEEDLRDLARRQLALVLRPKLMQLRRLVIAEVKEFPELGRTFYELGPRRTIDELAKTFEKLAARGLLRIHEPQLAAVQFNWLIMSVPLNDAMLLGTDGPPSADEIEQWAHAGVRTFVAAFGP